MSVHIDGKAVATVHDSLPAIPITPPYCADERNTYRCNVEWRGHLYSLTWYGSQQYPTLSAFPDVLSGKLCRVDESPVISDLRRRSEFLAAGAHASIRREPSSNFPIVKLAHPDDISRALIQREYDIIKKLSGLALAVPIVSDVPVLADGNICGYRMVELYDIRREEMQGLLGEVKQTVARFHDVGYSHGDLSPSNVMKDVNGRVTLIDLSFSGKLDDQIPSWFPGWVYSGSTFDKESDLNRLKKYWR